MKKETTLNLALFLLRAVVGVIFVIHGAQKLFGMFNGIGLDGTAKIVEGMGLARPYLFATGWACTELVGGAFLILGILARWGSAAIMVTVFVQLWKINMVYGSFAFDLNGGMEHNVLIIGACLPLVLLGGGSWSVWDF